MVEVAAICTFLLTQGPAAAVGWPNVANYFHLKGSLPENAAFDVQMLSLTDKCVAALLLTAQLLSFILSRGARGIY